MNLLATLYILCTALSQTEQPAESFYEEFSKKRNEINALRARFSQTTTTPDEIISSTGTIVYTSPKRILFRYDDPELYYLLDGQRAFEYDAELRQLQIFEVEDRPEAEAFYLGFEQNADRLMEAYYVRVLNLRDPARKFLELELTPREPDSEAAFFKKLTMHLRNGDFLPTKIRIVNDEESDVVYEIGEFSVNDPELRSENRIFLPEGTVIVENDAFVERVGADGRYVPIAEPIVNAEPVSGSDR